MAAEVHADRPQVPTAEDTFLSVQPLARSGTRLTEEVGRVDSGGS